MNTPQTSCRLIIVNDGSSEPTVGYLRDFCDRHPFARRIDSNQSEGYTKAANKGMRAATADYVILLNSDTIVPQRWIERLVECGQSDDRIGIVGPLSNAASYQSVPEVRSADGDWSVNPLPGDMTIDEMADMIDRLSERRFPRVPFINGYCYVIKRRVIETIGIFDEDAFPMGFGEENDYSLRAGQAGFELAVADHAYVYHAKSRSYGPHRRKELTRAGRLALEQKHGAQRITDGIRTMEGTRALDPLRQRLRAERVGHAGREPLPDFRGIRILYLLRGKGGGGGVHSIYQEASGMRRFGVFSQIALPRKVAESYKRFYPHAPESLFHFYDQETDLLSYARGFDIIVATIFTTVRTLRQIVEHDPHIIPAYYIQDYEPWIIRDPTPELVQEARDSYTAIPGMLCFAKTDWIRQTVFEHHGTHVHKVRPSLDTAVYNAERIRKPSDGRVHIVAMVRPSTPRRAPKETMEVLRTLQQRYPDKVRVTIFGNEPDSPDFLAMPRDFEFTNRGVLVREEVADLMGSADIFIDLSVYQAFGRTGLEAMAVGCATVLPAKGGVYEYGIHRRNTLIVDTSHNDEAIAALDELVTDPVFRATLQKNGLETASRFSIRSAVISELTMFREAILKRRETAAGGAQGRSGTS